MDDDLDVPDCGMGEAVPWITLGVAGLAGLTVTAGWLVRALYGIARDPAAWHMLTGR